MQRLHILRTIYWEGIRFVGHVFIDWTLVEEIYLVFPSKACDIAVAGVVLHNMCIYPFQDPKSHIEEVEG